MVDKYKNFEKLKEGEMECKDYRISKLERDSRILVIAIHGGEIEFLTTQIACRISCEKYSFYSFEGIKPSCNRETLHITSTHFDEPIAEGLLKNADWVVSIHGKSEQDQEYVMVGGRNEKLKIKVSQSLKSNGFKMEPPTGKYKGEETDNICNRCKKNGGVQLEISCKLRKSLQNDKKEFDKFCNAVREAIKSFLAEI